MILAKEAIRISGLVFLIAVLFGCDYARMNNQESVKTYKKKMPLMDVRTVPVQPGYQFLSHANPAALKNPLPGDSKTIEQGGLAYTYFCIQCHGPKADGNGTVGQSFAPLPSNLRGANVQSQSDGQLFSKILLGFGRHPNLYTTVSEEDAWTIVHYIRSLKKS